MSESRTYLLDPLYETPTLKLPPDAVDYLVMGSGTVLSLTGMAAFAGSVGGMLASLAPGVLAGAGALIKLGEDTVVDRLTRRLGHRARRRALNPREEEHEAPAGTTPAGAFFTGAEDLSFHSQDDAAFPQARGRLLAAFAWVTDGAALKDPAHLHRSHAALSAFLEWVAATGPGACVRIAHQVVPYVEDAPDLRAAGSDDLAASYRQLQALVGATCDAHTTVIALSVPARGKDVDEQLAWLRTAYEQASACGLDTGPLWPKQSWMQALSPELTDGPFEVNEEYFRATGHLHATARVVDFRRGSRAAGFWRPMVTTLPRVARTTVVEYLPLDRRQAERRLENGDVMRTATARDEDDARREKTSTRTGRRAADVHEEDLDDGATYTKVAVRITVHAVDESELSAFRTEVEQAAVSAGARLSWMTREHETGWRSTLPLPGGEITC